MKNPSFINADEIFKAAPPGASPFQTCLVRSNWKAAPSCLRQVAPSITDESFLVRSHQRALGFQSAIMVCWRGNCLLTASLSS